MDMVIPPPPPPPPALPHENMPSKPPPPPPQHAAIPYNPASSHPVQETGGPPEAVHDFQSTEEAGAEAQLPPPEGPEDGLSDDEKKNYPVQETEPATETSISSQVEGDDEALRQTDDGED